MKRVAREDHVDQDWLSKAKSQIKGSTLKNIPLPKPIKSVSQDLGGIDCPQALRGCC